MIARGAAQDLLSLDEVALVNQPGSEEAKGLDIIRALFHGNAGGGQGFLRTARLVQGDAEIQVSTARLGVVSDDVAEEGDLVPVDSRLAPGHRSQKRQHHHHKPCRSRLESAWQPAGAVGGGPDQDRHDPDAGQVLKAVGHKGVQHVAVIHETQHRRKCHCKKQGPGQWPAPDPAAQEPQRCRQRRRPGQGQPGPRVPDADFPARVDDGQVGGPDQLARVEPQGPRGDEHPLGQGVVQGGSVP